MVGGEGEGGVLRPGDVSLIGEDLEDGLNPGEVLEDGLYPGEVLEDGLYPGEVLEDEWYPGEVLEDGLYPGEVLEAGLYPGGSMSSILGFGNLYPERDGGKLRCKLNSSLEKLTHSLIHPIFVLSYYLVYVRLFEPPH